MFAPNLGQLVSSTVNALYFKALWFWVLVLESRIHYEPLLLLIA